MKQSSFATNLPIFQSDDSFENEKQFSSSYEAFDTISTYHRKRIMRLSTASEPTTCEFELVFCPTSDKRYFIDGLYSTPVWIARSHFHSW